MQAELPMSGPALAEDVRAELERVLARPEFHREASLLEDFLEWLWPRLPSERLAVLGELLPWILAGLLLGIVLMLGLRLLRAARAEGEQPARPAPGAPGELERRLAELRARARRARESGDLRLALRLSFLALLLALGGRGDLEFRPAWTNRELLRRGKPSRAALALLETLVRELEPKEFGRDQVRASDLDRLESLLERARAGAA